MENKIEQIYKQKFDKLLAKAKHIYNNENDVLIRHTIEELFPEIRESEDEKIRKELIKHLQEGAEGYEPAGGSSDYKRWLAWLEKQGQKEKDILEDAILDGYILDGNEDGLIAETIRYKHEKQGGQKPAWGEAGEINKEILNAAILFAMNSADEFACNGVSKEDVIDWLKSFKNRVQSQQKQEWNEEDSIRLQRIIDFLWYNRKGDTDTIYQQEQDIDWLKSLRLQNHWKPSDRQMDSITCAVKKMKESACYDSELVSLLNDLKKLKEE